MVVPCDSPMIDRMAAVRLWNTLKQRDIIMTARGSRGTEPLVGIYPKKAEPQMRQMLLAGTYRMRDILEQIGYETVRIDDEKLVKRTLDRIPLRWIAKPEEISSFVINILKNFSEYTTGSIFNIDGGRELTS